MGDTVYATPAHPDLDKKTEAPSGDHYSGEHTCKDEKTMANDYHGVVSAKLFEVSEGQQGYDKFKQLSWPRLTVCLIVEAIALGALSLPHAFAKVGMVGGVLLAVGIGLVSIYTSYLVGAVCNRQWDIPVHHYSDIGFLMWGRWGREVVAGGLILFLVLVTGSHALTGAIALDTIADGRACKLVWSIVSAIILFVLALPTTFEKVAILGYIDFISIVAAILITMIATGIRGGDQPGGLDGVNWSATAEESVSFVDAFNAVTDIVFAYSFAVCQPTFQAELRRPGDYMKSIWTLGLVEITIYTLTGSLIYCFVGRDVQSPALLSAGLTVSRVAFGVALPVIYISGAINTTTAARYFHGRIFKYSEHQYINTPLGIAVWVVLCAGLTAISWAIAEAIPFFSSLLSVISSLLISGFTFYLPATMWFLLLKEGKWNASAKNIFLCIANGLILAGGLTVLGAGMYTASMSIKYGYQDGTVGHPFQCSWGELET